jgi:23S rRNA (cytidine1920-2'-O)/16S rRNA (cytidine1409-2'-O)-methyltransferase
MGMAKISKSRVDILLVERGLAKSRDRAKALVMAGSVFSGGRRIDKAGDTLPSDCDLVVRSTIHPWVSRGGIKLVHALEYFNLSTSGAVALDVGASTGGFTDVLLEYRARKVYAVDVGHGQLAWKLRQDDRVVVLERTNARYLARAGSRASGCNRLRCELHRSRTGLASCYESSSISGGPSRTD